MEISRDQVIAKLTSPGMDYEIIDGKVLGRPCRMFKNAPLTLRELFETSRSEATFLVYGSDRYSFNETADISAQLGNCLLARYGVSKGDRIAISMRNYPEWVFAFNAITSIGCVAVAMNSLWQSEEMAFALNDSGSRLLIADDERIDRFFEIRSKTNVDVVGVRALSGSAREIESLESLLEEQANVLPDIAIDPDDMATILYTSGSTGHPKGVVSCHRNILNALFSWELDAQINSELGYTDQALSSYQPAMLLGVPLFHASGSHAVMLASYRSQRKLVSMRKWDVEEAASLIEREQISAFLGPAAMTGDLERYARSSKFDLGTMIAVGGGGSPRAPEQVKRIKDSFSAALPSTGWGMTETNAIGSGIAGRDYLAHPGSSGRVSAVLDLRIVDPDGVVQDRNEIGELEVSGVSVIKGYWNRPEQNAQTFNDGWLKTGDVAYIDDEGYLFIVDRIKDLVIRGGENIGCAEVEAALLSCPGVKEASVYALPDERLGEIVGATLTIIQPFSEVELRNFLENNLAKFKIPELMILSDKSLPRIASGKIDKRRIREEAVNFHRP